MKLYFCSSEKGSQKLWKLSSLILISFLRSSKNIHLMKLSLMIQLFISP